MSFKLLIKYSLIGCVIGTIIFFEPALLLTSFLIFSIILFIRSRPEEDRRILTRVVSIAFFMRLVFFSICIIYVYFSYLNIYEYGIIGKIIGHSVQAMRDFEREITNGYLIGRYFRGEFGGIPIRDISFQGHGYLHFGAYFQGVLNFLFGESIFNLASVPLISLWLVVIYYYLAKEVFDERVGFFSSLIIAILPSINVWSCTNIRTMFGIFGILFMAYCLTKFFRKNNWKYVVPLFISIFIFSVVKDKFFRPAVFIITLVLFLSINMRFRFKILTCMAISILAIGSGAFQNTIRGTLEDIVNSQIGFFSMQIGSYYKIYDDSVYILTTAANIPLASLVDLMFRALPKGVLYFLFTPFPWETNNTMRLFGYPQTIFWYFMFVLAIFGLLKAAAERNTRILPTIYISCFFIILFSLVLGNEGIAARFRDMISPFFYMFACFALCNLCPPHKCPKVGEK